MKEKLLTQTKLIEHKLMDGKLVVYVKEPTFLDMQQAAQHLIGENGIDLSDYWQYAFSHWVVETKPPMATVELLRLKPEVGKALSAVLPSPEDLVDMLGFSKAEPTSSITL